MTDGLRRSPASLVGAAHLGGCFAAAAAEGYSVGAAEDCTEGELECAACPFTRNPYAEGASATPAWVPCPACDCCLCTVHGRHAHDCPCPPVDEWDTSPYLPQPLPRRPL